MSATHQCPAMSCGVTVPNARFACRAHWFALSLDTRRAISATAHLPITHERRWEIVSDAIDELNK